MDLSSILGLLLSQKQMDDVATRANASADETKSVLTSALGLLTNNASNGNITSSVLGSLSGNTDTSSLITSLLGVGGAATVAQESGVNESATNNVLGAVAPMVLGSLTGSDSNKPSGLMSMLTGLMGGGSLDSVGSLLGGLVSTATDEAEEAVETVTGAAANAKEETKTEAKKAESGLMGLIGKLFGKK